VPPPRVGTGPPARPGSPGAPGKGIRLGQCCLTVGLTVPPLICAVLLSYASAGLTEGTGSTTEIWPAHAPPRAGLTCRLVGLTGQGWPNLSWISSQGKAKIEQRDQRHFTA
jgi:hypothetical protein